MWRKSADEKTNPQSSNVPEPVATAPKAGQNAPAATTSATPSPIAQTSTPPSTPSYSAPATANNPFGAAPRANSVSVIGAGLKIQGEITGDSDLVIEGAAHGRIRMVNGRVTVAANGRVNADIEAVEISVDGNVQGGLKASDCVRLGPASQVQGSVMARRIAIEDGARLRGKVEMIRAEVAASVAKTTMVSAPAPTTTVTATTAPTMGATPNAPKAADATPATITEADRMKATAARGSGD